MQGIFVILEVEERQCNLNGSRSVVGYINQIERLGRHCKFHGKLRGVSVVFPNYFYPSVALKTSSNKSSCKIYTWHINIYKKITEDTTIVSGTLSNGLY